ncbi:MAG TPA: serine--tRNA ligase [Actinobacteria bacterium]|nr:serine--tRNA ligase [Actinomycetota bacterium]
MLDPALLREDPARLAEAMARRGVELDVDALVELDRRRREVRREAETLRARQKELGKEIPRLEGADRDAAVAEAGELSKRYKELLDEADRLDAEFMERWVRLPNLPDPTAAEGLTEEDAVELSRWGTPPEFPFEPKDHVELGERLGIIDIERAAKISGSRFGIVKGPLAVLEFALVRWALDLLEPHGFVPALPPVLVREHALFGTGFFPGDRDQVYRVDDGELYLVGTSEVSLAAMHGDEILAAEDLPLRYAGFSTCFRREAGTYGKDTRGIFRVHQFDKLEMFSFVHPDASREEHDFLLAREEEIVQGLGIPYRVVNVAAGDLGASAAKKYDIEAWFPSQGRYREITSTSNTTDYQARRLRIRFADERGNRLVHTLNGTAIAMGRTLIAIVENFQDADGTITVPEVLVPYAGFERIG